MIRSSNFDGTLKGSKIKMPATRAMDPRQQNQIAAQAIRNFAVRRLQSLNPVTFDPAQRPVLTVTPVPVGLVLGFYVKVVHTVDNGSAVQIDTTDFGPANSVAQFQFQDLANQTRIQTPGAHVNFINSWKSKRPYGSALIGSSATNTGAQTTGVAYVGQDDPTKYGSNWTINSAPTSIAAGDTKTVTQWYYIPLAYNPDNPRMPDFRGAIYAGTTAANLQLQIYMPGAAGSTFNAGGSVCVANGVDSTFAMFVGDAAGAVGSVTITSTTVTVYQDYYDQIPDGSQFTGQPGILLPLMDLSTIYELKNTTLSGLPANVETGYQYANFRSFISTIAIYVQSATTGARGTGADINYFALQAANNSNIWKAEPNYFALQARQHMGVDFPAGAYLFDSRQSPVNTQQFGVMQLVINPITVNANNYMTVMVENFQLINAQGQSLPSS
jgi:hypothetical protein